MKMNIPVLSLVSVLLFSSCGNDQTTNADTNGRNARADSVSSTTAGTLENHMAGLNELVSGYLDIKNALAGDKGKDAAAAAGKMPGSFEKINAASMDAAQKKAIEEVKYDIIEHAQHIEANGNNISHQREHFDMLSQDMIDLVKITGSPMNLYKDFCPMYNNKKGAFWLSETKEIKNPYYGSEMPECGEVKEEIRAKG